MDDFEVSPPPCWASSTYATVIFLNHGFIIGDTTYSVRHVAKIKINTIEAKEIDHRHYFDAVGFHANSAVIAAVSREYHLRQGEQAKLNLRKAALEKYGTQEAKLYLAPVTAAEITMTSGETLKVLVDDNKGFNIMQRNWLHPLVTVVD